MRRTRKCIVVYGEELTLPAASMEKLRQFEASLEAELADLELRWQARSRYTTVVPDRKPSSHLSSA